MPTDKLSKKIKMSLYEKMVCIRTFEEKLVEMAEEGGQLTGMQILSNGQEAVAVGMTAPLQPTDVIVSNHRNHGHLLAKGADPKFLMAEIMCKATGVNKGKSGTLHMSVPEVNAILTSTVVGASPLLAAGVSFAQQYKATGAVTVVFFGDGAAAEGSVHEAMNLAGVWKLPILFVCENNQWAGAQRLSAHSSAPDIIKRAAGYSMPGEAIDGNDVEKVYLTAKKMVEHCRSGSGPAMIEAKTYRMRGHSESDRQHYVDSSELQAWADLCPIKCYEAKLLLENIISQGDVDSVNAKYIEIVNDAVKFGLESPYPAPEEALDDLWT